MITCNDLEGFEGKPKCCVYCHLDVHERVDDGENWDVCAPVWLWLWDHYVDTYEPPDPTNPLTASILEYISIMKED